MIKEGTTTFKRRDWPEIIHSAKALADNACDRMLLLGIIQRVNTSRRPAIYRINIGAKGSAPDPSPGIKERLIEMRDKSENDRDRRIGHFLLTLTEQGERSFTSADWNNVFHMSKTVYGNDLRRALNLGLVQKVAAGKGGNHCIYELCQNIEPDIRADSLTLSQRKNLTDMFAEFHGRQFSVEECGKLLGISNPTAAFHLKNFAERGLLEEHRRPGKAYNYSFRVKPDENPECFVVTGHTDYIGRAGTQSQIRGGSVAVAG